MIKLVLTKFWFVFLPIIFYFVWVFIMTRRAKDGGAIAEHIRKGLLFWAIMLSFGLLFGCFLWLGFTQETKTEGRYVPPSVVDGRVVPGHMVDDK